MEWNEDDYERVQEIQSMSPDFIKDAIEWWNSVASETIKRFVVVTCYYEWLAMQADKADDVLVDWNKEV